jgi:hypothetical protein
MQNFLNSTTHSVAWFLKRYQSNELELKAPFQRNPVWTTKQKGYLIDSILRGFPIPELYMQEYTDAAGNDKYVVVDGQQRLRACLEFVEGRFTLDPDDSPDLADMSFYDLSEDQKKQFYGYNFVVRVLPEMPEQDLRAMFQRLNRNVVALNPQELRHATYWGEFIKTIESLTNDDRWTLCGVFTPNDIRRMIDAEFISELVVGLLHGHQNKKEKLDDWYQAYEREFSKKDEMVSIVQSTLGELLAILPDIERTRWRKKSDFYSLFLFLARNARLFPLSREGRRGAREGLVAFARAVDAFLTDPEIQGIPDAAKKYALAVERAASDLANRRTREEMLSGLFKELLDAEKLAISEAVNGTPTTAEPNQAN